MRHIGRWLYVALLLRARVIASWSRDAVNEGGVATIGRRA
jgi:hypothetical protein